jgi:hypothetical protein
MHDGKVRRGTMHHIDVGVGIEGYLFVQVYGVFSPPGLFMDSQKPAPTLSTHASSDIYR